MHKNCIGKFRKCSHVKEEVHCLMDLYSKCLTATIFHVQNYFSLTSTADKTENCMEGLIHQCTKENKNQSSSVKLNL